MRRVGEVVRVAQSVAVVRTAADEYPDVGTALVDEELTAVGRVVDVFGPVDRPYLAVAPDAETHLPALVGSKLYAR